MQEVNQEINQEAIPEVNQEAVPEVNTEVNPEIKREAVPEKDLFRGYEIRNWNFTPRFYKIIAGSAIFNIVALFVFAQSNLLTTKGCDSPFVSTVCQVIDTVYVGSSIFGVDSEYADFKVDPTKLGEDSEVIFIDVTGETPPITYPAGYFATANPENFITDENGEPIHISQLNNPLDPSGFNPTTPNPTQPDLTNVTPNYPKPTKGNPLEGDYPKDPYSVGGNPTVNNPPTAKNGKGKRGKNPPDDPPGKLPTLPGEDVAGNNDGEKPPVNSDPVEEVKLNKSELRKLAKTASEKWSFVPGKPDKQIVIKPFKVVLNGKLTKKMVEDENGQKLEVVAFDDKKSKWAPIKPEEAGDPEMVALAKEAVQAVGDSGFLGYLYNLELKDLKITLVQVGNKIVVNVESEMPTEERAKTKASGLNGLLGGAKFIVKEGTNEKVLLDNALKTPPTSKGKKVIMNFEIPVEQAEELIRKNLESEAQKEKEKSNSTAQTPGQNLKTGK